MRAFIIKRKGKTWFGNMLHNYKISINDNTFYADLIFYKKKDAKIFLKTEFSKDIQDMFEIIGVTIDKSNQDNRKLN